MTGMTATQQDHRQRAGAAAIIAVGEHLAGTCGWRSPRCRSRPAVITNTMSKTLSAMIKMVVADGDERAPGCTGDDHAEEDAELAGAIDAGGFQQLSPAPP